MSVIQEIADERQRQISSEGWSETHDDTHAKGEISSAAACYALGRKVIAHCVLWPWDHAWWKPTNRRRDLIKAAALIVAEIERLDRAAQKSEAA